MGLLSSFYLYGSALETAGLGIIGTLVEKTPWCHPFPQNSFVKLTIYRLYYKLVASAS